MRVLCFFLLTLSFATPALALPWMVKHNYGSCVACHVDPSGAGQLTEYGRAQADILLRWRPTPRKETDEIPKSANFLWSTELPPAVNLSGNLRGGALLRRPSGTQSIAPVLMAADLYGTVNANRFVFHASAGFGLRSYVAPAIVAPHCKPSSGQPQCGPSFIAREFWAGAKFADFADENAVMVRAGRMHVPFGLRNNEHFTFVRDMTQTDINTGQQVGASALYNSELFRGELMALLGNYQIAPDIYRERGYSLYGEYALRPNAYVGVSSLMTYATRPLVRHAHGVFARVAPIKSLALLFEGDVLAWHQTDMTPRVGFATMLQGDWEPLQGIHIMATVEAARTRQAELNLGYWVTAAWYALPHVELRLDNILRHSPTINAASTLNYTLLLQLHTFL